MKTNAVTGDIEHMNYDCRPIRQNYTAHAIVVLLFVFSGVSFALSGFMPPSGVLWQMLGLVLLLPAIQLIARYMASRYLYRLHVYEDGRADLEIFLYRGGDKMQMVCCVSLADITAAAPLCANNARAPKGVKRQDYAPDLHPLRALVLSVSHAESVYEVLFCPDEYLTRVINDAIAARQTVQK